VVALFGFLLTDELLWKIIWLMQIIFVNLQQKY